MDLSGDSVLSDIDPIIGGVLSEDGTPGSQFIPPPNTEEQTDYVEMLMDYVPVWLHDWSHDIKLGEVSGDKLVLLVVIAATLLLVHMVNQCLAKSGR